MNVSAALVNQSMPFAGLVMARPGGASDLFAILYAVAFGLLMSLIASSDDHGAFVQAITAVGQFD